MKVITHICFFALLAAGTLLAACGDDDKKPIIPVTEITVTGASGSEFLVKEDETLLVTAIALPENASYRRVFFESSNEDIFTVTQRGVITGEGFGTATLRIFAADGSGVSVNIPVDVDYNASITNVRTPGSLAQLTSSLTTKELRLAGTLNAEDMKTLTTLAVSKALTTIDLSMVTSVPGNTLKGHTTDGVGLFENAGSLTSVIAPNTITAVGDNCFQNAPALTTVTLPASVTSVGSKAFSGSANLTSLTLGAATPPTVASDAFGDLELEEIKLTVPSGSTDAYREVSVWKEMTVNGIAPASETYVIPAATGVDQWVTVELSAPLLTSEEWVLKSVSTQVATSADQIQFGVSGWGVHLFDLAYTGTVSGLGNKPFEFYLGSTMQGGTKIGAIGRGNWNSGTNSLTPYAISLNQPVTITLTCDGAGNIAMTLQNDGVNNGEPIDFKTATGVETITAVKAAQPVPAYVSIKRK